MSLWSGPVFGCMPMRTAPIITVSLDLSGESLHRRGYRGAAGEAPLKENVAAGMLMRCGWPEMAASGAQFLDPMCGSGTLVIEAAMIAADIAPGLGREYYGFLGWRGHDPQLWQEVLEAAEDARPHATAAAVITLVRLRATRSPPHACRSCAAATAIASSNAHRASATRDRAGVGRMVCVRNRAPAPTPSPARRIEPRRWRRIECWRCAHADPARAADVGDVPALSSAVAGEARRWPTVSASHRCGRPCDSRSGLALR